MNTRNFITEMLKRLTALRVKYTILNEAEIIVRINQAKWLVKALEPVPGDERKSVVQLISVSDGEKIVFEKPCTTYYLLQYLTGHSTK